MTRVWHLVRREGGTADITEGCFVKLRCGNEMGPVSEDGEGWTLPRMWALFWFRTGAWQEPIAALDITHVSTEPSDD